MKTAYVIDGVVYMNNYTAQKIASLRKAEVKRIKILNDNEYLTVEDAMAVFGADKHKLVREKTTTKTGPSTSPKVVVQDKTFVILSKKVGDFEAQARLEVVRYGKRSTYLKGNSDALLIGGKNV